MTLRDPIVIATIRGLLTALGQAAFTGLTTYQVTGNAGDSAVVGALAFLVALGIRGGVEGVWDQRRGARQDEPAPPVLHDDRTVVHDYGDGGTATLSRAASAKGTGPGPIPPIDFDKPYHRNAAGKPHPGNYAADCPWCLAESKPAT